MQLISHFPFLSIISFFELNDEPVNLDQGHCPVVPLDSEGTISSSLKDIDGTTGLCTKIGFDTDFNEPLEESPGCPMSTHSDGYKLCIFLWNCLNASETGSIGCMSSI